MLLLTLALKELRKSRSKLGLVFFILVVGFLGPFLTATLRSSVDEYLVIRSRQILSADLAVSSFRALREEERALLLRELKPIKVASEIEFITMGKSSSTTQLVEVRAVDEAFPILGVFQRDNEPPLESAQPLAEEPIAWVFPEVLTQLGLKLGDQIELGQKRFRITTKLIDGPGSARFGGFAPRIYISRKFAEETGLTGFGSQVTYRTYLQLPPSTEIGRAAEIVKEHLPDPDIFLRTPDDSVRSFERFFSFFNLYLVSATMIVFALAWVAAFYILQIFIQDRLKNAAVLISVGAGRLKTGLLYVIQIFVIVAGALLVTIVIAETLAFMVSLFAKEQLPKEFVFQIRAKDVVAFLVVAATSAFAFSLPLYVRLLLLRLQTLMGESSLGVERVPAKILFASYLPVGLVFLALSTWLMGSFAKAFGLLGGLLGTSLLGWYIGKSLFYAFFRVVKERPGLLRLIATHLARSRFGVNLCFLVLLLVTISVGLVGHLLKSAVAEMSPGQGREIPALFLFNIPESSVDSLRQFAGTRNGEIRYLSPMIQARLQKVNNEAAQSDQFQRFPVRLTYREKPIVSEKVVSGKEFSGRYKEGALVPAEISVEIQFAERNELKLGDVIDFDVQGVPLQAKIVNFRKVKWTDFNPNFFFVFQLGVLEEAPKTYLANVVMPNDEKQKADFQYELIRQFPDLSVIDVGRTLTRILDVVNTVLGPVRAAAWIGAVMSLLVLLGVISHNLKMRHAEMDIEKLLGADFRMIRNMIVSEYAIIALFATAFGSLASIGLGYFVSSRILDIPGHISWVTLIASAFVAMGVSLSIAWVSSTRRLTSGRGA